MASVRDCARAYAQALILGAAALTFSGCEITRQLDRDVPRVDSNRANSSTDVDSYASTDADNYACMGSGSIFDIPLPPGQMAPAPRQYLAGSSNRDVLADIVDLDEMLAETKMQTQQREAQRRLNEEADDPMNTRNPANWLRSNEPKEPPKYLNEEQIKPLMRYTDKAWF